MRRECRHDVSLSGLRSARQTLKENATVPLRGRTESTSLPEARETSDPLVARSGTAKLGFGFSWARPGRPIRARRAFALVCIQSSCVVCIWL
jgi:hypothetical protein